MKVAQEIFRNVENVPLFLKSSNSYIIQTRNKHSKNRQTHLEECQKKSSESFEPCNPPKKSFWGIFKRRKDPKCFEKEKKEVRECETVKITRDSQAVCEMKNIAQMGGQVYRTCGSAYLLQKDYVDQPELKTDQEEKILKEMEKHPSLKGQVDPMPPFESVEMRLIDLSERKLHPSYKRLMSIPKKSKPLPKQLIAPPRKPKYKTRSGQVLPEEIPEHFKINKDLFEKKNILYEFKKVEPPQQLMARMIEMKQNERPTLEKKFGCIEASKDFQK